MSAMKRYMVIVTKKPWKYENGLNNMFAMYYSSRLPMYKMLFSDVVRGIHF